MSRTNDTPQKIVVKGTAFEQGLEHGRLSAPLICENIELMKQVVAKSSFDTAKFQNYLKANYDFLSKTEPDLIQELKGIQKGSGLDFEDILLINIPLFFVFNWLPQECSMVYFGPQATKDGRSYLMKNRDMGFKLRHIVLCRQYEDGKSIIEVNGAGIVTYPGNGINGEGLAMATTGVWSKRIPITLEQANSSHVLINSHLILEKCSSVDEAVSYLEQLPRMNGLNLILADKTKACVIEMTRDQIATHEPKNGVLFRSNHYLSEEFSHLNQTPEEYPSTHMRYSRIEEYTNSRLGNLAFQDMLSIASDHKNGPVNCICRHGTCDAPSKTIYSSTIVLEDQQVWTTMTNPCESYLCCDLRV